MRSPLPEASSFWWVGRAKQQHTPPSGTPSQAHPARHLDDFVQAQREHMVQMGVQGHMGHARAVSRELANAAARVALQHVHTHVLPCARRHAGGAGARGLLEAHSNGMG